MLLPCSVQISKCMGNWGKSYWQTSFHESGVKDEFRTDILYCRFMALSWPCRQLMSTKSTPFRDAKCWLTTASTVIDPKLIHPFDWFAILDEEFNHKTSSIDALTFKLQKNWQSVVEIVTDLTLKLLWYITRSQFWIILSGHQKIFEVIKYQRKNPMDWRVKQPKKCGN